jgi:hypothetical protein
MPSYDPSKSEIDNYADSTPSEDIKTFNPIQWWAGMAGPNDFPTLFQYALDTLCCPAMSTECERVFSSTKKLITSERNALSEDIIEACEWYALHCILRETQCKPIPPGAWGHVRVRRDFSSTNGFQTVKPQPKVVALEFDCLRPGHPFP